MDVLSTPRSSAIGKGYGDLVETPITDFSVIERQKENIRPSATGRSAATLSSLFEMEEAAKIINEGHETHRRSIEEAERRDMEGEDMEEGYSDLLDVYTKYITFTNQHHPSSSTHILPLLERTARKFVDDRRYAQDIRLLRVWTQYARYTDRREEIWAFLETKEVGTNHAEFYEQWATSLEALKRKKKADDVYRLGIARRAAPIERLKNRHQAFLARIMAPPDGFVPDDEPTSVLPRPSSRSALGQVASATSISGATPISTVGRSSKAPNGAKMEIFTDSADVRGEDGPNNEWSDFGTRDSRRKENVMEATPWKGETLPQKRAAPRTPKVEVFRDANENESVKPAEEHLLRIRAPQSEAELLKHDPLRNFDLSGMKAVEPPTLPPPPQVKEVKTRKYSKVVARPAEELGRPWTVPTDGPEIKDPKGKTQRRMFDWDAVYKNADEWSFEEIRARQRGLLGKEWKGEVQDWERQWHSPGSSTPKKEPPKKKMPSPTVNTKLAQEEVGSWFNQTIHGGKIRDDSDSEDEDEDEEDEDDGGVAIPPTPLPAPGSAMRPALGMVPPTPTPNAIGRPLMATPAPMVYADENAMAPPSTSKRFNIFSETPAKTPLAPKTPLGVSLSKPKGFGIFSDIMEEEERDEIATPSIRRTALTPLNIFATPAVDSKVLSQAIPEEEEHVVEEEAVEEPSKRNIIATSSDPRPFVPFVEETQQEVIEEEPQNIQIEENVQTEIRPSSPVSALAAAVAAPRSMASSSNIFATPAVKRSVFSRQPLANAFVEEDEEEPTMGDKAHGEYVNINEEDEECEQEMQGLSRFRAFPYLTPIAERTCEYTSYTQSSALKQSTLSQRSNSIENDAFLTSTEPTVPVGLSAVEEEEERSQSLRKTKSPRESANSAFSAFDQGVDQSGIAGPEFALPEGFTIHAKPKRESDGADSVVVTDGQTMRSRQGTTEPEHLERSVDNEEVEEDNDGTDFVTAQHGSITNPCCPLDDDVLAHVLDRLSPPLSSMPNYHDHRSTAIARLDALNKYTAAKPRRSSAAGSRASIAPEAGFMLDLGGRTFEVREKIGEGGYGAVFCGVDVAARQVLDDADSDDEDEDDAEEQCMVAIKVERPASVWESVILNRIRSRLDDPLLSSLISQKDLYAFADESYLLLEYSNQGTLLDVVNKASSMGIAPATAGPVSSMDELVAIFFTAELLRIVESMHLADFIHGDLKIDNCMIRLEDIPNSAWSTTYDPSGANGWSKKGIRLIDFGRAIDLTLFDPEQRFIADWKVDQRDCVEMRRGESWTFETDYFGLAGICYCMLFGRYIDTVETTEDGARRYKIDQPLKRYWQADLWNPLFDLLLNPKLDGERSLPISNELHEIREKFEGWLVENCQKGGKSLRAMLKKIELAAMTARRG